MTRECDFRKLKLAAQVEARRNAVAMVKSGMKRIEVADIIGVNRRFVGEWVAAEAALGPVALDSKKRGRRPGEQKALTLDEEKKICQLIADKSPDQLKLPFALWTREAVALLIERKTTKRLSVHVVGDKQATAKRRTPRTKDALRNEVHSHLEDLQARPAKVRAFFQAKSVRYAA